MEKSKRNILYSDRGITGVDLVTSIVIFTIFIGVITQLMSSAYKTSLEIQKSANANAYATMVLEKIDEKAFEEIDNNFVNTLRDSGEITIDSNYSITMETTSVEGIDENVMKKVVLIIKYDVNGEERQLLINKLKVKEIYNNA